MMENKSKTQSNVKKRTVVITGANFGLGFESTKQFVFHNYREWDVLMACRDETKVKAAADQLREEFKEKQLKHHISQEASFDIHFIPIDLSSLASIRSFATKLKEKLEKQEIPPLGALICNAGVQNTNIYYTKDGYESTFGVNHIGHFLLTNLLLPLFDVQNYDDNRIVIVSSDLHNPEEKKRMPPPQLKSVKEMAFPNIEEEGEIAMTRYCTSKLCNVLFTYELSSRLQQHPLYKGKITVNAFNPGLMPGTGLARDYNKMLQFIWFNVGPKLNHFFPKRFRSAAVSGSQLTSLITDKELKGVTSKYYDGDTEKPSSTESYDKKKQFDLFEDSKELVKLSDVNEFIV
ncbi:hypothetical protein ABK040_008570 [Willaertia magna]